MPSDSPENVLKPKTWHYSQIDSAKAQGLSENPKSNLKKKISPNGYRHNLD